MCSMKTIPVWGWGWGLGGGVILFSSHYIIFCVYWDFVHVTLHIKIYWASLWRLWATHGHIQQQASLEVTSSAIPNRSCFFIVCFMPQAGYAFFTASHFTFKFVPEHLMIFRQEIILKSSPIPAVCGSAGCADPCWGWVAAAICVTDCACAWEAGCEDSCCFCEAAALPRDNMPPRPRPVPAGAWPGA